MPADQPLPCPFCGGPTEVRTNDDNAAWVRCMKRPGCEAEGPVIKLARPADAQGRAIAAWNRIVARTPDPRVAELEKEVRALAATANYIGGELINGRNPAWCANKLFDQQAVTNWIRQDDKECEDAARVERERDALEGQVAVLREALLEVQNSADPDELIDRALSTDAGKREAAVIAAARGVVLSRKGRGSDGPSEYYEAIDDLHKAVDALDAGGRDG